VALLQPEPPFEVRRVVELLPEEARAEYARAVAADGRAGA